MDITCEVWGNA